MAAISMSLPDVISIPVSEADYSMQSSTDELFDQLTEHILDCDLCLYGNECDCARYRNLREQIATKSCCNKGVALAF